MADIEHIVFDIGRVLLHYDPDIPFRRLIPDNERRRWFFQNVCTTEWNLEQDRGRSWQEAEAILIESYPQEADNIRGFRQNWHEMISHHYEGSVAILETLIENGQDVTMLTNFAADTLAEARQRFEFLNRPRGVTVSGEVGLLKPDAAIYDHHVKAFDLKPAATLFIDDSPANVDGAIDAGWQAVHFKNAEALKADLERFGLGL